MNHGSLPLTRWNAKGLGAVSAASGPVLSPYGTACRIRNPPAPTTAGPMGGRRLHQVQLHVGANVRRLRVRRGLTQAELAGALGVDLRSVQRLEAGDAMSLGGIVAVADALEVPVAQLFRAAEHRRRPAGRPKAR